MSAIGGYADRHKATDKLRCINKTQNKGIGYD